jgi:hypothetical protein
MRNINDVLREKEAELQQLEKEIEVLRLAASLLAEEETPAVSGPVAPVAAPQAQPPAPSSKKKLISEMPVPVTPASHQFP